MDIEIKDGEIILSLTKEEYEVICCGISCLYNDCSYNIPLADKLYWEYANWNELHEKLLEEV